MNYIGTIIVAAVVLVLFVLALRSSIKNKNSCSGCSGNCSQCHYNSTQKKK